MSRIYKKSNFAGTNASTGIAFGGGGGGGGGSSSSSSSNIYRNVTSGCLWGSAGAVVATAGAVAVPNPITISGATIAWGNAISQCVGDN